jgi:glycosyltransferase involved in cell wall biosynthesis
MLGFAAGLFRLPALAAELSHFARTQGIEVVISAMSHLWTPLVAPGLARARFAYIPVIHDAKPHPGDHATLFDWRLDRELAAARAAVVLSEAVADTIAIRRPSLPLIRLPLGAHFALPVVPSAAITGWDFLFFGRFRHYKGLDLLRDAWQILRAVHPAATLRVVGEGDVDRVAPGLSKLPGVVVEARWVPDAEIPAVIASARALVLPYREASQSGVVPLALAAAVPVVVTAVGGLIEQVSDGVSGLVVPPDSASLARGMASMLEPRLRGNLAAGARLAGTRLTDWRAHADALEDGIARALRR